MVTNLRVGKVVKAFYDGRDRKYIVREFVKLFQTEAAKCEEVGGHGNVVTFLLTELKEV